MQRHLFDGLSGAAHDEALSVFRTYELGRGEVLVVEDEVDRGMLVIVSGEVVVTRGGVELARLGPGDTVGEETLFGTTDRRSATVTTAGACTVLALDEDGIARLRAQENPVVAELEARVLHVLGERLREMNRRIAALAARAPQARDAGPAGLFARAGAAPGTPPTERPPDPVAVLQRAPGFAERPREDLAALAARLELVAAPAGGVLIQAGRRAESAYIVCAGRVEVTTPLDGGGEERVALLGPGQLFGHVALADAQARSATCRALDPCYLLRIPLATFQTLTAEQSPAGRALRRGLIEALSGQLRLANAHFVALRGSTPTWGA